MSLLKTLFGMTSSTDATEADRAGDTETVRRIVGDLIRNGYDGAISASLGAVLGQATEVALLAAALARFKSIALPRQALAR